MGLKEIGKKIRKDLEAKDRVREIALPKSRHTIRSASLAIRAIHRANFKEAQNYLAEAKKHLKEAQKVLKDFPNIYFAGFLQDAEKEFSEALLTYAFVTGEKLPDPDEIGVGYTPFLLGLGEAMGELRRHILDIIRQGKLKEGEHFLTTMDEIYYFLLSFDFPDALTPGLRRITDFTKSVIERTRGDLTIALSQKRLGKSLEKFSKKIGE
jgi:translin